MRTLWTMRVSVIIPAYNEESVLPLLLSDLAKQSERDLEVIVADAGSSDRTREVAAETGAVVVDGGLPGVGRNRGAAIARGETLVFLDSDVRIPSDFLRAALDEMDRRRVDVATAEARPLSDLALDRLIHRMANLFIRLNQEIEPHAPGYCILVRNEVFRKTGGFNEDVLVAEDHDFVSRAADHGTFRMLLDPWFQVSVRRYEKEGRIAYSLKAARITLYRLLNGEITDPEIVEYEFGDFTAEDKNTAQKVLRKIESGIIDVDRNIQEMERNLEDAIARGTRKLEGFQEPLDWARKALKDVGDALFGDDDD